MLILPLLGLALLGPIALAMVLIPRVVIAPVSGWRTLFFALAGSVAFAPATFLWMLGAYGDWSVLFFACLFGAGYAILVADIVERRRRSPQPDR